MALESIVQFQGAQAALAALPPVNDALSKCADKVVSIFKGLGFDEILFPPRSEREFSNWKNKKIKVLLEEFLIAQSPDNLKSFNSIVAALKLNVNAVDELLGVLPNDAEKDRWWALRHALITTREKTFTFAKSFLSKRLEQHLIAEEDYNNQLTLLTQINGDAENDPYAEPTYIELLSKVDRALDSESDDLFLRWIFTLPRDSSEREPCESKESEPK